MGIFDKLKGEFIDIVEWEEQSPEVLVWKFQRHNNEIKYGAKLIVRPGQKAIFVNEGKVADVFTEGTHELETRNLPILSTLQGWKHGFESPFKAEVYFIDTTEQLDRKWGTPNPVTLRDADFGIVRLRCRGNYSYRVSMNEELLAKFVGSQDLFTTEDIEGQLRTKVISSFSDAIGEMKIPALDLPTKYDEIGDHCKEKLSEDFIGMGLDILQFTLENISLPEAVQQAIDERGAVGAHGGMNQYSQFQQAQALRDAANNEGMAGNMMGMMVGGQLAGGVSPNQQGAMIICPKCQHKNNQDAKFCSGCGTSLVVETVDCVKCEKDIPKDSKFCPECGSPQESNCKACSKEIEPGAKFCPHCGASQA